MENNTQAISTTNSSQGDSNTSPVDLTRDPQAWSFEKQIQFVTETEQLLEQHNRDHFEIGMRLMLIRDYKLYLNYDGGYRSFEEYLQKVKSKFDYERKSLFNFMKLYGYFVKELNIEVGTLLKMPYTRLLDIERYFKDEPKEKIIEMVMAQEHMPAYEFRKMKVEAGIVNERPNVFKNPDGKWTIEVRKSSVHRITNLEDSTDMYHE